MPSPRPSRAKSAVAPAASRPVVDHQARAPFGFIFFFILLVGTFAFSTFYVVSQAARDQAIREEAVENALILEQRVNALQTQVNTLSERLSLQQAALDRLAPSTSTLPTTRPAQR